MMPRPRRVTADLPPHMIRRVKPRKDGSCWIGCYYQPAGTRDAIPLGSDLLTAKKKWAELEGQRFISGTVTDIRDRHLKSDGKLVSPRTQFDREDYWKRLAPVFGHVPMDNLRSEDMFRYFDARSAKHSAKKELKYLSVLCTWALSRGLMTVKHPLAGGMMKLMKAPGGRTRYVTDEEFAAVKAQAHPVMRDYLDLLYLTGQRPADIRKLTWSDLFDGHLHIRQGKTQVALRIAVVGALSECLEHIRKRGVVGLRLLVDPKGGALKEFGWARSEFDRARNASGVDFQLRDLRAKAATDSETMTQARKLLGHSTENMTAHYVKKHAGEKVQPLSVGKPLASGRETARPKRTRK